MIEDALAAEVVRELVEGVCRKHAMSTWPQVDADADLRVTVLLDAEDMERVEMPLREALERVPYAIRITRRGRAATRS